MSNESQIEEEVVVDQSVDQLENQSVDQLVDQSVDQLEDQSVDQIEDQSVDQSVDQIEDQSVDQSVDQIEDQSVDQSVDQIEDQSVDQIEDQSANESGDLIGSESVEEAVIVVADEEQIKVILGFTIAMVYLLDSSSDGVNRPVFDVHHIPFTSDIIQELIQFKVQLYFSIIDRINSLVALKNSKEFTEYVSLLDDIWTQFEKRSDEQLSESESLLPFEVLEEMAFHETKFRQFLNQFCCAQRAIELICSDCEKQSIDFGDIFGADILQRSLRSVNDSFNEIADRLSNRVERLKQIYETND